jgi:hypothetical protein
LIVRAAQLPDGSWYIVTRGFGNNAEPGMDAMNQFYGPQQFNILDGQLAAVGRADDTYGP